MAQRKAHQVEDWLARPDMKPALVLIYGPDRGLVSERAQRFARSTGLALDDAFSVVRLDASDLDRDPGRLIDEANTVAMFGGERLIWVKGAAGQTALATAAGELVKQLLAETTVLIEAGELKKSAKLRTIVEKSDVAMALPCYGDEARALDGLIDAQLSAAGMTISLDARNLLKRSLGGDRLASRNEIDKLILFAHGNKHIEITDVALSTGDAAGLSQDQIVDAVLGGDAAGFERHYARMVHSGSAPFLSAAAAMRQFHMLQILRAKVENENKTAAAAVASARPPVFFARRSLVEKAVASMSSEFINRALERLQVTILKARQHSDLAPELVGRALLAVTLEANAAHRKR